MKSEEYIGLKECARPISLDEAFSLIDDVIDDLIEVGNGITDDKLHEDADKLFMVRDRYIKPCNDNESSATLIIADESSVFEQEQYEYIKSRVAKAAKPPEKALFGEASRVDRWGVQKEEL